MDPNEESVANRSFAHAFAIAKEALKYIGTFQTPPTPRVYELWYRFVEGNNQALNRELSTAVNANEITVEMINDLYQRYFPPSIDYELHHRASQTLASEVQQLQAVLHHQYDIGNDFQQQVENVSEELRGAGPNSEILGQCITAILSGNENVQKQINDTNHRLADSQRQITELRQELLKSQRVMLTDTLTGIGNRRYFESIIDQAVARLGHPAPEAPNNKQTALLLVDLDDFKRINDGFGHAAGDDVLKFIATELQKIAPDSSAARIGGDEFAVVHHVDNAEEAEELADSIRQQFSQQAMVLKRSKVNIGQLTLSIGVALLRPTDTRESFFNRADQLLYVSKNGGRNRISMEPKVGR